MDDRRGSNVSEEVTLAVATMNCGVAAAVEAVHMEGLGPYAHLSLLQLTRNCISACARQLLDARMELYHRGSSDKALGVSARASLSTTRG